MAADKHLDRKARLAAALKQNLRRRKCGPAAPEPHKVSHGAASAAENESRPFAHVSPKSASKRN